MPTVLSDKLSALEGQTESPTVAEHLSSLHLARKAFIMAESSEKIQRALRKQDKLVLFILLVMKFIIKEVITISGKVQLKLLDKMVLLFLFVMVGNLLRHTFVVFSQQIHVSQSKKVELL